ncbi:MAG: DUF2283 domain-containing protein [Ignavibacteriales bacterium]|nr:DUF2283 domain-containing protein [Ignavibacteriales bacterium]
MKLHYDQNVDALYIRLDDSEILDSEEVKEGIILDFNKNDSVVGIEILNVSKRIPVMELKKIQFEFA